MAGTAPPLSDRTKLDTILRLSSLLARSIKIQDVLNNAMEGIEECLQAQDSSIYEIDYETGELVFRLARGVKGDELTARRIKIGEGVAGWVAQTGLPKVVTDPDADRHFYNGFDRELGYRTHSILTAPLIAKGAVIGVVQVLNRKDRQPFSAADLELLQIMAGQIAIAMENANLYRKLEEKHLHTEEQLRLTQERLIKSERQAALSGLAQGIAHQIRNPSMSIGGFARRILEKAPADQKELRRYAQVIVDEIMHLEELVKQVHLLTGLESEPVFSDLNVLTAQTVEDLSKTEGMPKIHMTLAEALPRLALDPKLIPRALKEVLKNSREAGASGVEVRTLVRGDRVLLEIEDDGPGISPEDLPSVLDAFFSTKAHSLGLGLAVVQRIMQEHRGDVDIASPERRGVIATLSLPIQPSPLS